MWTAMKRMKSVQMTYLWREGNGVFGQVVEHNLGEGECLRKGDEVYWY